ncbi:Clp protease N-terminal domain-containing protein [Nonomuraea dietziae]|uniref:Clp protease N-terminal domain-containing protein n=1 Tax=Nonomuraea dietziae TaxID=65515 RepID=UPI0031DF0A9A
MRCSTPSASHAPSAPPHIGPEHLLLALAANPTPPRPLLAEQGVSAGELQTATLAEPERGVTPKGETPRSTSTAET